MPIVALPGGKGLALRPEKSRKTPSFPNLSALAAHYAAKKRSGLHCRLRPDALDGDEIETAFEATETVDRRPSHLNPAYAPGSPALTDSLYLSMQRDESYSVVVSLVLVSRESACVWWREEVSRGNRSLEAG